MNNIFKIIISVIKQLLLVIIALLVVELVSTYWRGKPIFCEKDGDNYKGIFFDVYNCPEYPTPQIVSKWTKYNCGVEVKDYTKNRIVGDTKVECTEEPKLYVDGKRKIYTSCINTLYVSDGNGMLTDFKKFIKNDITVVDELLKNYEGMPFNDGGSVMYEIKDVTGIIRIYQCHYLGGNHNIYIGNESLINMCK